MKNLCVFTKEFLQEEDAVGVVRDHSDSGSSDWAGHDL